MFSKLFILGLSALSIVGGFPTQSPDPAASCGVPLKSCNGKLTTPGLYYIRQPLGGEMRYLTDPAQSGSVHMWHPGPKVRHYPVWWVRKVGEDQFQLQPFYPRVQPNILAVASSTDTPGVNLVRTALDATSPLVSTWAIESAGYKLWTIKVPGDDAVWKSNSTEAVPTISLEPADGTHEEHWDFQYYGDHYDF